VQPTVQPSVQPACPMGEARLVRRLFERPRPLPIVPGRHDDGWLLAGLAEGPVEQLDGPYVLSGGWWRRALRRDYHFATLRSGARLWVYHDHGRRRWFLHGRVE
jgi:protein ImuB